MAATLSSAAAFHLFTALPALGLGALMLASPKGTLPHRWLGRIWVAFMLATAISSFWVRHNGFSWLHGLSVVSLLAVGFGVYFIRRGNLRRHRRSMIGAYLGLVGAFIGTLQPGRFVYAWLFG